MQAYFEQDFAAQNEFGRGGLTPKWPRILDVHHKSRYAMRAFTGEHLFYTIHAQYEIPCAQRV